MSGLTGGLVNIGGQKCDARAFGEMAALIPLPEDIGAQVFAKLAERYPRIAQILVRQQASKSVTQPGKATIGKDSSRISATPVGRIGMSA